ncbi:uncharacterized protein LOC119770806 [Culex quinquefasciatus]|uniref:uncharacterized protein LOC119770806 n=1 Tax=Culex quinquefasciatus TaxID=7176 RepID=UPI0018E3C5D9|nr:uncharacterized protein LOC119770806 [Culex quinquefasciatus]
MSSKTGSRPPRQQPHRSAKRPKLANVHLPPEIWEHIFRFIPGFQLLRLRLICHHWNDVISGSPALMGRFHFCVTGRGRQGRMTRDYAPPGLNTMVTQVVVRKFRIEGVGAWFRDIAPRLTELHLIDCDLSVEVLFGMLRLTPNLKSLVLNFLRFTGSAEPEFRLNRLTYLFFDHVGDKTEDHVLNGFERMAPCLETLDLGINIESKKVEVLEWIRTMQASLRNLQLPREPYIMEGLCQLKELRLKLVSLNATFPDDLELWTRFCRMQPHVEILTITTNDAEILAETGRLLPKLRQLALIVPGPMEVSFLATMPLLDYLEITGSNVYPVAKVSFLSHSCPSMEQFVLKNVETKDVFQFLHQSPKLARLHLDDCSLDYCQVVQRNFPNLISLTLDSIHYPIYLLDVVFNHCPKLEELHLFGLRYLDDNVVRDFCKKLKLLKKLSLVFLRCVTDESARYITRYCRVLEELSADFSDAVLDRIEATRRNIRVKRSIYSDDEDDDDHDDE